jgi:hypothetical protein
MTHRRKRCRHCGTVYYFQASGMDCCSKFNDEKYCRDCMETIRKALDKVETKFESEYVECNDVAFETLVNIEKKNEAMAEKMGRIFAKRITVPLFDLNNPSNSNYTGMVNIGDETYIYSGWTKTPEKNKVFKLMERNLKTRELNKWV